MDLPLVDGSYKWADGKSVGTYDSTIVVIQTDHPDGIVGYNFTCHNCQSIPFFSQPIYGFDFDTKAVKKWCILGTASLQF